jgi:hypothetical protein
VVCFFGGVESKAKNSKVAHEHREHREHNEFILVRPPESKTLRPVVVVDCLRIAYCYKGSPCPPYIGQRARSVPRLLVSYLGRTGRDAGALDRASAGGLSPGWGGWRQGDQGPRCRGRS